MTLKLTHHVTISREVLFQELDGEAVLLDIASESYFGLDDVGTRIGSSCRSTAVCGPFSTRCWTSTTWSPRAWRKTC